MRMQLSLVALLTVPLASVARADDWQPEPGFRSLFNGRDLTGWCFRARAERDSPKAGAVAEKFDGKTESSDAGRYSARDGILTVNFPRSRSGSSPRSTPWRSSLKDFTPQARIPPPGAQRRQRHLHPQAAAPVPRSIRRGRPLQADHRRNTGRRTGTRSRSWSRMAWPAAPATARSWRPSSGCPKPVRSVSRATAARWSTVASRSSKPRGSRMGATAKPGSPNHAALQRQFGPLSKGGRSSKLPEMG